MDTNVIIFKKKTCIVHLRIIRIYCTDTTGFTHKSV